MTEAFHRPEPEHVATVIPIESKRSDSQFNPELVDPGRLADTVSIHFLLSTIRHPSTPPDEVAARLLAPMDGEWGEAWAARLRQAVENIEISDELYDALSDNHPDFQEMQAYMKETAKTRSDVELRADQRKVVLLLMDMYGAAATDGTGQLSTAEVGEVFHKLVDEDD